MLSLNLEVNEDDLLAVQSAVSFRQSKFRREGSLVLPPGDGDLRARLLAEICRGWLQMVVGKECPGQMTDRELYCEIHELPVEEETVSGYVDSDGGDDDEEDDDVSEFGPPFEIDDLADDGPTA